MQNAQIIKTSFAVVGIMLVGLIVLFLSTTKSEFGQARQSFADLGGDFTLQSHQGDVTLSQYKGKVVVFYFGFLTCPEVCPDSIATIARALNKLTDEQLTNVEAMLISLDPQRDTFEKLEEFSQYFHPKLIGVTGSKEVLDKVTYQYGAYYNFTDVDSEGEYGVEHSSRYYVIDKNGKFVSAMRHSTTSSELAAMLKSLI